MNTNHLDIRIKLLKKGYSLADVARKCDESRQMVYVALTTKGKKRGRYIKIRRTIAEIIGKPPERLWPKTFRKAA